MNATNRNAADRLQLVTFRVGDDLFAADVHAVERVLRHAPPRGIPNVPHWIEGVIDYRGRVVPVIDLRKRFELSTAPVTAGTRILVLAVEEEWVGAVVDAVVEVATVSAAEISPPPKLFHGLAGEYLRGVVRRKDGLVVLLDVVRILSTNDRIVLEHAAAEAAAADTAAADTAAADTAASDGVAARGTSSEEAPGA